jgi:hypothetical protein
MLSFATHMGAGPVGAWAVYLNFADLDQISESATEGAMYCYANRIINGEPNPSNPSGQNLFAPKQSATRAEVSAMLHRYSETRAARQEK